MVRDASVEKKRYLDLAQWRKVDSRGAFPHEDIPTPSTYVEGMPTFILDRKAGRVIGKEARRGNILEAKGVTELLKNTLGPNGMDKLVMDKEGHIWVTKSGSKIMSKIEWGHPVVALMAGTANAINKDVGDGVTSTLILAGHILEEYGKLLDKKIHPSVLLQGCVMAVEKSLSIMNELAMPIDEKDRLMLEKIARTAMSGRLDNGHIAKIVVDAILKVKDEKNSEVDLNHILIRKMKGGSLADTRLIEGVALSNEVTHTNMPLRVDNARIAVLRGELRINKRGLTREMVHKTTVDSTARLKSLKEEEARMFKEMAGKIAAVKANVIFVEKGINEPVLDHLARLGVLAIRRIIIENLEKIARAVGAKVVSNINILSTEDLGFAKLVDERKIGGKRWIFIEGCRRAKAVTILVRGTNQDLLTETETSIGEGLSAVRNVLKKPKAVVGGGALEMEIAMRLRKWAEKHDKREQLAIKGFAEALETIPFALAENSGLNSLDAILEMRSRHSKCEVSVGIDADKRQIANLDDKIYDPILVKEQMVISAFETSSVILRVDDFVKGKELTQRELYYEQRRKGTSPERMEDMRKDYGIEHLETD